MKKRECVVCGREEYIFSKNRCKSCSMKSYKKPSRTIKPKANKVELDNYFEDKITQLKRLGKSEESGTAIPYPTRANICHLFNKRNHKSVANHSENYVFLTVDEHNELDNKCLDVNNFEELKKRFPNSFELIMERAISVRRDVTEKTKFVEALDKYVENFN